MLKTGQNGDEISKYLKRLKGILKCLFTCPKQCPHYVQTMFVIREDGAKLTRLVNHHVSAEKKSWKYIFILS